MSTDMERQAIIDKIARLLRLAEGSENQNEAASAAAKAQELMDRYKLSRLLVEQHSDADSEEPVSTFEEEPLLSGSLSRWRIRLLDALARINDCVMLLRTQKRDAGHGRAWLVGRASDVEVTRYLFVYLEREIARIGASELERQVPRPREPDVWHNDFCYGAASVVFHRIQQMRIGVQGDALKSEQGKKALVALRHRSAPVEAFVQQLTGGSCLHVGTQGVDLGAHMAGRRAGEHIPIHEAVTSGENPHPQIGENTNAHSKS